MSRTITVPNLSVEDFVRFKAAQRAGKTDDLAARDVLRAGLDAIDAKQAEKKAKAKEARAKKKATKKKATKKKAPSKKKATKVTLDAPKPETLED